MREILRDDASSTVRRRAVSSQKVEGTAFGYVEEDQVWVFDAAGQWSDWYVRCGPNGYRNFLADLFGVRPIMPNAPFFALIGRINDGPFFQIGSRTILTCDRSGPLILLTNDAGGWFGNNRGAITVEGRLVDVEPPQPVESEGFAAGWQRLHELYRRTLGIPLAAVLAIGACLILAATDQGVDLLRTQAEDRSLRLVAFAATLLFLAIQVWFWSRVVVDSNYGLDRTQWRPRVLLEKGPRILGIAPFIPVIVALLGAPDPSYVFVIALVLLMVVLFFGLIHRQDVLKKIRGRRGLDEDEPPWPFGRWWAVASFAIAITGMVIATFAPVRLGVTLGAPAVVFLALGSIIPIVVTVSQLGSAMRLPVASAALCSAALFSLWVDNHTIGRRAFGETVRSDVRGRVSLKAAYARWLKAQPEIGVKPTMVLVASEGGASRAGFWTAQVLAALHDETRGRLARHLFAINAVSGGSVGAVGYVSAIQASPKISGRELANQLRLFVGADALGPAMTGMLFPDLLQRFLPLSLLPDRAEALERSWETAWATSCLPENVGCPGLLKEPFLSLGPETDGSWRPFVIVQGASEETGRRILTSRLKLDQQEVDADDFYAIVDHDVAASTAIHNGARFPWISPAGSLTNTQGRQGHLVDGGYFDAAGVETVRELARAIRSLEEGRDQRIVVVFIGYSGAKAAAQAPTVVGGPTISPDSKIASTRSKNEGQDAKPPQAQRTQAISFINEAFAPLRGLFASRDAHGAHLMRETKLSVTAPGSADPYERSSPTNEVDYIPVILCDGVGKDGELKPPMDWALSETMQSYLVRATGHWDLSSPGCNADTPRSAKAAIHAIAEAIGSHE